MQLVYAVVAFSIVLLPIAARVDGYSDGVYCFECCKHGCTLC